MIDCMNELQRHIQDYGRKQLADDAGISAALVGHVMTGIRQFGVPSAKKVAPVLNIPLSVVRPDIWGEL